MRPRTLIGSTLALGYMATIPLANLAVQHLGAVPVWPGVAAPAGVYFVGIALVLRDFVRETLGRAAVVAAIFTGVVLSFVSSTPVLALASAAAFTISETADFIVYERQRRRGMTVALAASNVAGLVADSLVFLGVAFGSLHYLPGQLLGKAWMTLAVVVVLVAWRRSGAQAVFV